jgi:2',3'-cyclic-nucleotide 2'-phosphodiesterase (5'-nucleotidase family)
MQFKTRYIYITLLLFLVSACWQKKQVSATYISAKSIPVKNIVADSTNATMPMLAPYRAQMDKTMNAIIGNIDVALKKDKPNGTLGSMVCDAMLASAKTIDKNTIIAIGNYGGLRIPSISAGAVSLGKIYELMPFENTLSIIPLAGNWIDTFCQKIAKSGGMPISGLSFSIKNKKASKIMVGGQAIDYTKIYTTCVNSYMASGGDDCEFLIAMPKQTTTLLIRDAIIEYIKMCNANKISVVQEPIKRIVEE